MKPKLVIYGHGSMALTYASYLKQQYDIVGFTVEEKIKESDTFNGYPLFTFEQLSHFCSPSHHALIVAVGYIEMNTIRQTIAAKASEMGYHLISYLDPSVKQHDQVQFGHNTLILEHTSIHCNSSIGNNVFISSGVNIGHDCEIGNNVWINAGVCLGGGVKIKDNSFVGMNATISHGLTIGANNFIGAATLVTKTTEPNKVIIAPAGEILPMNSETFLRFSKVMNND